MSLWNLVPMPSLRIALVLFPVGAGGEGTSRHAPRGIDQGSAASRRRRAGGRAAEAIGQEPEWEGQWRILKYL